MAEPSILGALRDPQFRSDTLRNLVDALNGAKRSLTVGSLGAAGDMGNTLANLVRAGAGTAYHETTGRPIPQALEYRDPARDFGTSASLGNFAERQGWLPPQTYSMPEQAGALLGPIAAMGLPDLGNATLRGLVAAAKSEPSRRMIEGYVDALGARPKATVYHGSPHQFDAFDSSKIGTGEGAQSYGHGLYLAEAQDVAKKYKPDRSYVGASLQGSPANMNFDDPQWIAGSTLDRFGDVAQAEAHLTGVLKANSRSQRPEQIASNAAISQALELIRSGKLSPSGSLYKVDLPDPLIARMLDWDKPLSQQAPEVRAALPDFPSSMKGGDAYSALKYGQKPVGFDENGRALFDGMTALRSIGNGGAGRASELLRDMGIPGIRYLDGGSRADGAGTSNFVLFPGEESALTILERNGKPVRR